MDKNTLKTSGNIIKIASLIAIICMVAIGFFVYRAPFIQVGAFILFVLIYVLLPGLGILRLLKINPDHISSQLLLEQLKLFEYLRNQYAYYNFFFIASAIF
jgi:hypothetical protein